MPSAARRGREAFNQGRFFEAHEHWEDVWKTAAPARRPHYRALIQLSAACLKIEQGKYGPARRLLLRALSALTQSDLATDPLAATLEVVLHRLEQLGPDRLAEVNARFFPILGPDVT